MEPEVGLAEAILPFPIAVLWRENGLWPPIADPCRDIGLDAIEALFTKETRNLLFIILLMKKRPIKDLKES